MMNIYHQVLLFLLWLKMNTSSLHFDCRRRNSAEHKRDYNSLDWNAVETLSVA